MNKKGFTLIELLVVVLIIGILAAIAVPQYQKAVIKTKYSNLKALTTSFYRAQQRYYLANNDYADTFDKLDINIGNGPYDRTYVYSGIRGQYCSINKRDSYVFCKDEKIHLSYVIQFNGKRLCHTYSNNPLANAICKDETGKETNIDVNTGYSYPDAI